MSLYNLYLLLNVYEEIASAEGGLCLGTILSLQTDGTRKLLYTLCMGLAFVLFWSRHERFLTSLSQF